MGRGTLDSLMYVSEDGSNDSEGDGDGEVQGIELEGEGDSMRSTGWMK